ncbi:MAG TPA: hypothetical protein VIH59_21330 [Candidatus Tectomicrobia bacterium]|jgi:uncharacterized oxidoreductase
MPTIAPDELHRIGKVLFQAAGGRDIAAFVACLKDMPPAEGFTEVLYPGELEYRMAQQCRRDGIYVEDETWRQLTALQQEYGLT